MSTARAPPNSTVTSRCTLHETLSGPKYPRSAMHSSLSEVSGTSDARDPSELARDGFGGEDHQVVPRPRAADVQVLVEVLEVLLAELGQDHHRPLEPLERVHAGSQDGARLDGLGQAEAVDRPFAAQAALVLARGRQHDDVLERDLLLLDQVAQHHREQVLEILLSLVSEDLDGLPLGAASDRFLLALVEDRDELADLLGVPEIEGDRSHP